MLHRCLRLTDPSTLRSKAFRQGDTVSPCRRSAPLIEVVIAFPRSMNLFNPLEPVTSFQNVAKSIQDFLRGDSERQHS
jgi:hypothetical protein